MGEKFKYAWIATLVFILADMYEADPPYINIQVEVDDDLDDGIYLVTVRKEGIFLKSVEPDIFRSSLYEIIEAPYDGSNIAPLLVNMYSTIGFASLKTRATKYIKMRDPNSTFRLPFDLGRVIWLKCRIEVDLFHWNVG